MKSIVTNLFFCALMVVSCTSTRKLGTVRFDKQTTAIIRSTFGCCGCAHYRISFYTNRKLTQQFIHEFECGFGEPTLFVFKHKGNKIIGANAYVVRNNTKPLTPPTPHQKRGLEILDSLNNISQFSKSRIAYKELNDIRLSLNKSIVHPFYYRSKNKAVYIR